MAKVSSKGISLVKKFEGLYTKAYRDPVGIWTIGYGITNADYSITKVKIKSGLVISAKTADNWLEKSLNKKYLPLVMKYNSIYHWNQNEIDALTSFAYNVGSINGLTANGTRSRAMIAKKMLEYNKAGVNELEGLKKRRKAERELFLTPVKKTASSKKTYAKVATKSDPLTFRKSATSTSVAIGKIKKGTSVEVIKKGTSWTKIKYKSKTGYVATKYLKF